MVVSKLLPLLTLTMAFLLAVPPVYSERRGFRAAMTRTGTAINFTRAAHESQLRLSMLTAKLDAAAGRVSTQTPLRSDSASGLGAYEMEFSIGTPPLKLSALADTGSDLIWAKCGTCASCTPRRSPSYYPDKSSSFSKLPCSSDLCTALRSRSSCRDTECDYRYFYGLSADHYTQGYLGSETFTLGGDAVQGVGFGCTTMSDGNYGTGSGLVGLGRGPLSLVKQLDVGAFSYCLTPDVSKSSPLLFGSLATLTGAGVQSTPLLGDGTFYTVNLQSISFGSATTPGTGQNGVVFDSGTTFTFLTEPAYTAAKNQILSQTALPRATDTDGFEACFQVPDNTNSVDVPSMVLHFDGADMNLPAANYFKEVADGVLCWIVQMSPSTLSLIGNIMQMNYHVQYDVDKAVLSFQQTDCDKL